ncbi:MAG TPA: FAD-binding oxidoreductase [Gaiellaceae bacterium]|nr:FAD-binding oxidoreductase [Gaiellaceae bacterium]
MRNVAIVGAGIAGLALALELRRLGCRATVIEARYPGAGNSTRNVGRVRRMQLTRDLTELSCRASDKWRSVRALTGGRNPLLYPTRYAWALYGEDEVAALSPMQEMWGDCGARARVVSARELLRAVPILDGGEPVVGGVLGEAAIVHHDAAVYAYFQAASDAGVELRLGVRATELDDEAVRTSDGGEVAADAVVNAAGGRSGELARLWGIDAPNVPVRREVLVTQPRRPFMTPAVTFYRPQEGWFNQTLRGELVAGVVDPDEPVGFEEGSSVRFLARTARVLLAKAPRLSGLRVIRQWAGVYDTTPDKRPLVGEYAERPGVYALNGWSGRGILLAPLAAELLARELAGLGRDPMLEPFAPARFAGSAAETRIHADYYSGYAH